MTRWTSASSRLSWSGQARPRISGTGPGCWQRHWDCGGGRRWRTFVMSDSPPPPARGHKSSGLTGRNSRPRARPPSGSATLPPEIAASVSPLNPRLSDRRLVTLPGPGGVGKTRLAIETAAQSAAAFPDGTWLVEMAGPSPATALSPADEVMSVMGIRNDSSISSADLLGGALRDSRLLLVLDNCEHLIGQVAKLAARLLQSAPELRVMVTSREPLMIAGEVIWAVPPLDLPDPDADHEPAALARSTSVRLVTIRAEPSAPGFPLDDDNP